MTARCRCCRGQPNPVSKQPEDDLLLINSLHKLPYHQRYALNPFDLLLCPHELPLETPLLVLDVLFLKVDVPATG
jgi:hypothetical protein